MGYASIKSKNLGTTSTATPRIVNATGGASFPKFVSPVQGENMVLLVHPSCMNYLWCIVFGVLLVPFLIGVAMLLYVYVNVKTTSYVVTNKRVVTKTGLLNVNQTEVRIDDIRGVNLQRGLWQRLIGTGNVTVGTAATGGAEITILGVGNPGHVVECINAQRKS